MSRINYSDDGEDYPGQFNLWQANCRRSVRGRLGQKALREMEAALLALPSKRLIHGALQNETGEVCAIACYAKYKGLPISAPSDEEDDWDNDESEWGDAEVGVKAGMPKMVAWKLVALNDIDLDQRYVTCEGPSKYPYGQSGYRISVPYTPEERYESVLEWVRKQITEAKSA